MSIRQIKKASATIVIVLSTLVSACSEQKDSPSALIEECDFSLQAPGAIQQANIASSDLELTVLVQGQSVPMNRMDNYQWTGTAPCSQDVSVLVSWSIAGIELATLDTVISGNTSENVVTLLTNDYVLIDNDRDSFTNIQEINAGTDVNDAESFPIESDSATSGNNSPPATNGSEVINEVSTAVFDPANGQLPMPNDLLFSGSEDGTLNIPVENPLEFSDPRVAMNAVDGFSTTEPAVVNFVQSLTSTAASIDAGSVILGDTARIFEVTRSAGGVVAGVVKELDASSIIATVIPSDPTLSPNGSSIAFVPVKPLKEHTTYMAMVTNGVSNEQGVNLARGGVFDVLASNTAQSSETAAALQSLIMAMLAAGETAGVPADEVIMAWSFTTQSITPVLQALKEAAIPTSITIDTPLGGTGALSESSPDLANIFAGRMSVPYYLEAPSAENTTAPLSAFFKNASGKFLNPLDNTPVSSEFVTIPVLMTKPKGTAPLEGWPIAIFQHGIARTRTDMLALADAMASVQFAMIAIDLPLHGILPNDEIAFFIQPEIERHFGMDFTDNATSAQGPDGNIDRSGQYFFNLGNLLSTRDNTRQAVADLFTLSASLGSLDDINPSRKVFIGHSLGAIVGTTFLAYDDTVTNATLSSGGGGLPRLLAASPAFGPVIAAGLASAGVDINGVDGNAFLNAAQAVFDSSDPINHAAKLANSSTAIHMTQINRDTVIVNNLDGFPLVGTEALARNMGLSNVTETTVGSGFVKFEPGYHSSLLSPAIDENNSLVNITPEQAAAVYLELQKQVAQFAVSSTIVIEDSSVLATDTEASR